MAYAGGHAEEYRHLELFGQLERADGQVVGLLAGGRLQHRHLRELRIIAVVLLVLAGHHARIIRGHDHEAAVDAHVGQREQRVPTKPYANYDVGDEVEVVLKASMGMKAVWLAYCIPLLVLLGVILGLLALGVGEVVAGLSGIAAVGIYYFLLWYKPSLPGFRSLPGDNRCGGGSSAMTAGILPRTDHQSFL